MRSSISIVAALLTAAAALTATFVLWRTLEARDHIIEQALAGGRQRELEFAQRVQALSAAQEKLTEALARLPAAQTDGKMAGNLADRLTAVENTLASSAVTDADKLARDLNALRRDTQNAFNQVGIALAELKQQVPPVAKPPSAK